MPLTLEQITFRLERLEGWELTDNAISKQFTFADFTEALAFVNKVGELAEQADHHPDILIQYKDVTLTLSTHTDGGVTEKDFSLVEDIDKL